MVIISDYDVTNETMFDVTRLTSFLEKDASFLTPWSWDPKTSTKEKQYLSFHPESYFSYEIIDGMTRKKAQVNYNQCPPSARSSYSQARYSVPLMFLNQAPINFRSYSQAWCSVPLMFFNQAPICFMIPPIVMGTKWRVMPMPMPMPMPLPQIQNPLLWV